MPQLSVKLLIPMPSGRPLPLPQPVVVHGIERGAQSDGVPAGVQDRTHRLSVRQPLGGHEIAQPYLGRVDAQFVRDPIDGPLDQVRGLGPTGSPVGVDRRGVGEHAVDGDLGVRDRVEAERVRGDVDGRYPRPHGRQVGADVGHAADP
jgi:hypothetical protein